MTDSCQLLILERRNMAVVIEPERNQSEDETIIAVIWFLAAVKTFKIIGREVLKTEKRSFCQPSVSACIFPFSPVPILCYPLENYAE